MVKKSSIVFSALSEIFRAGNWWHKWFNRWVFWPSNHDDMGTKYLTFGVWAAFFGAWAGGILHYNSGFIPNGFSGDWGYALTMVMFIIIFFVVFPILIGGFGNWFVPLMVGVRYTAFPRLNYWSFWLLLLAYILLVWGFYNDSGVFDPVDTFSRHLPDYEKSMLGKCLLFFSFWLVIAVMVIQAMNLIKTVWDRRSPERHYSQLPLFVWSILIAAGFLLLLVPCMIVAVMLLLSDAYLETSFYGASAWNYGNVGYYQIFLLLGHPMMYILILPCFGIIWQVVSTYTEHSQIFEYWSMVVYVLVLTGGLGLIAWAYQVYMIGGRFTHMYFSIALMIITVPTWFQTYIWVAMSRLNRPFPTASMMGAWYFMIWMAFGGLMGLMITKVGWNLPTAGVISYAVPHFYYVVFGGFTLAIFAGWYQWSYYMTDLLHDTRLGAIQCFDFLLGCFVTVLPKFVVVTLELFNQPAYYNKIYTTLELITAMELVSFIGMGFIVHSFMVLVGELVILYFDPERTENKIEFAQCTYHFVEFEPPAKRHFLKSEIKRLSRLARLDPMNSMTYYHEYLSIAAMFVFPQPILYGLKVWR